MTWRAKTAADRQARAEASNYRAVERSGPVGALRLSGFGLHMHVQLVPLAAPGGGHGQGLLWPDWIVRPVGSGSNTYRTHVARRRGHRTEEVCAWNSLAMS
jgi:hypothetical protein